MNHIETRCVHESDYESFLFAVYECSRLEEMSGWGWNEKNVKEFLHMQFHCQQRSYHFNYPNLETRIIYFNDKKAGRLLLANIPDKIIVVDISLLTEFQKLGIGSFVLEQIMTNAKAGNQNVQLSVLKSNTAAIRLYERLGFCKINENEMYLQMATSIKGVG